MKVLVFGSLNIDNVYSLHRLPERGETLYCGSYEVHVGGKGLNQALALRKAGAQVVAAGKIGADGAFLTDYLSAGGVDVSEIDRTGAFTGHTVIEVDSEGQNQMILFGGANREIAPDYCDALLERHRDAALLLAQYETSCVAYMLEKARRAGIRTAFNPSPYVKELNGFPYEYADIIVLNESEGLQITGETDPQAAAVALQRKNRGQVILTLGGRGALYCDGTGVTEVPAFRAEAVDTTGAGDTFTGYCLQALLSGKAPREAMRIGAAAAAISVTKTGAAETIPDADEVTRFLKERKGS